MTRIGAQADSSFREYAETVRKARGERSLAELIRHCLIEAGEARGIRYENGRTVIASRRPPNALRKLPIHENVVYYGCPSCEGSFGMSDGEKPPTCSCGTVMIRCDIASLFEHRRADFCTATNGCPLYNEHRGHCMSVGIALSHCPSCHGYGRSTGRPDGPCQTCGGAPQTEHPGADFATTPEPAKPAIDLSKLTFVERQIFLALYPPDVVHWTSRKTILSIIKSVGIYTALDRLIQRGMIEGRATDEADFIASYRRLV